MTDDAQDPVLHRAIDELRRFPAVDSERVRRIIDAAALARVTAADEPVRRAPAWSASPWVRRSVRLWSTVGLAAAAAVIGFLARGEWMAVRPGVRVDNDASRAVAASAPLQPVAMQGSQPLMVPQQFVFGRPGAHRVAVVGDFNNWRATSNPMAHSADGTLWSALIPLSPGRHVYGFIIDDSLFVLDPREPRARDPDLGTEASVLIAGRP